MHRQAQAQLEAQSILVEQQGDRLARLNLENARLSKLLADANGSQERGPSSEVLKLRAEVGVLRNQLAAAAEHQNRRMEPPIQAAQKTGADRPYYDAGTWANVGYHDPQSAAITFLWAVSQTDQTAYNGAFGREMPEPEDVWADAYKSVRGSFLSDPVPQPNGDVQVTASHETTNGDIVDTVITYRQENGQWLIQGMTGFPVPNPTAMRPAPIVGSY